MQILPLLLVLILIAADEGVSPPAALHWELSQSNVILVAWGPVLAIVLLSALGMSWCRRRMDRGRGPGPIIIADRLARIARTLIVINHAAAVLMFGWLFVIRKAIGNLILVDELIALMPPLFGILALWWMYYPIERRVHEMLLIRQLDDGRPVYPMLSRRGYVLLQVRLHLLLMLVPILAILGLKEAAVRLAVAFAPPNHAKMLADVGTLLVAVGVFVTSPLLARVMLGVRPMPAGPIRDSLMDVCRRHRVKVRELLLWDTNGTMINAAVMGLIAPLRYVMVTDLLLDMLREDQVRAVMAHEIGHVRRHHMPWLVACLMASFALALIAVELVLRGADALSWLPNEPAEAATFIVNVAPLALGLLLFGWVSRRFERQADTFAVQHLSGLNESKSSDAGAAPPSNAQRVVSVESVRAMRGALAIIAELNTLDPNRKSWRHGSIAWRQAYLQTLIGRALLKLPIDRLIRWIKLAAAIILIGAFGSEALLSAYDRDAGGQKSEGRDQRAEVRSQKPVQHSVLRTQHSELNSP